MTLSWKAQVTVLGLTPDRSMTAEDVGDLQGGRPIASTYSETSVSGD